MKSTDGLEYLAAHEVARVEAAIQISAEQAQPVPVLPRQPWDKCGCGSSTCPVNVIHAEQLAAEQAMLERRDARQRAAVVAGLTARDKAAQQPDSRSVEWQILDQLKLMNNLMQEMLAAMSRGER